MEKIDVHDLPEEQAKLVAAFVEFLWQKRQESTAGHDTPAVPTRPERAPRPFAVWPLGVQRTLRREEVYEHL
jgi:hypothetical protein